MAKKQARKRKDSGSSEKQTKRKPKENNKLDPGKKQCKNCKEIIGIHRKVCTNCGHVHEMRKTKEHVMKSLNKITPTIIKSIIENNDFNQFKHWSDHHIYGVGSLVRISDLKLQKREELLSNTKMASEGPMKQFTSSNHPLFDYLVAQYPIPCLTSTKDLLIYVEQLAKEPTSLSENEELTIKAYDLQNFHCVGVDYLGESIIKLGKIGPLKSTPLVFDSILIKKNVVKIKCFSNLLALLTGQSSLIVFSYPIGALRTEPSDSIDYLLQDQVEIIEPRPDRITCFEFLKAASNFKEVFVAVGTLYGNLSVYRICQSGYELHRYIPNAHCEMVTCISECPLNNESTTLFASGSYDGIVAIWNLEERSYIFAIESSNKRVRSLAWDPGAKFIFITRDQMADSCIIACFFSINKIEANVHLSNQMEVRTIKGHKLRNITNYDYECKNFPLLDPIRGYFRLLGIEDLRGNSLKKKKLKKQEAINKTYKIELSDNNEVRVEEIQMNQEELNGDSEVGLESKKFPIFSDVAMQASEDTEYAYCSTYTGLIIRCSSK